MGQGLTELNKDLRRKLHSRGGYSLAEALICVLLLLLVSGAMVNGLQFALAQYRDSMELSQATILCSTLQTKLTTRLEDISYSSVHHNDAKAKEYPAFQMNNINSETGKSVKSEDGYGYVLMGSGSDASFEGDMILPKAAYTYGLKAKVRITHWPDGNKNNYFKIKIKIMDSDEEEELTSTVFDVELKD